MATISPEKMTYLVSRIEEFGSVLFGLTFFDVALVVNKRPTEIGWIRGRSIQIT